MQIKTKALVVLSGGQDSTICLYWARQRFDEVHAITFDYGQRHAIEVHAAQCVASLASVYSHEVIYVPDILKSTSPLTSASELEQYENSAQMESVIGSRIETTFVPMRNMFFLTVAMNRAIALGCDTVITGICQSDNANYPDCTEAFRASLQDTVNGSLGLAGSVFALKIVAPLMHMTKRDSVYMAQSMPGCMQALAYSHTSYDGKYPPTDMNHANVLRAQGFEEAGVPDPLVMRAWSEGLMDLPKTANYSNLTFKTILGIREAKS